MASPVPCRAYASGDVTMYALDRDATGGTQATAGLGIGPSAAGFFNDIYEIVGVAPAAVLPTSALAYQGDLAWTSSYEVTGGLVEQAGTWETVTGTQAWDGNGALGPVRMPGPITLGTSVLGPAAVVLADQDGEGVYALPGDRPLKDDRWVRLLASSPDEWIVVYATTGQQIPSTARYVALDDTFTVTDVPALDDATIALPLGPVLRWQDERNFIYVQLMCRTGLCVVHEVADGSVYSTPVPMLGPLLARWGNGPWFTSTSSIHSGDPSHPPAAGRWAPYAISLDGHSQLGYRFADEMAIGTHGTNLLIYVPNTDITQVVADMSLAHNGLAYSAAHDQLSHPGVRGNLYVIPLRHRTITDTYRISSYGFMSGGVAGSAQLTHSDTCALGDSPNGVDNGPGSMRSMLYAAGGPPQKLRLNQRTDGLGSARHPRLQSTAGNPPSSVQRQGAPRLGHNNRYR